MAEKGQVALVALCVLLCWIPVHGRAEFRPAPNVVHGDHDDEHVGYALSVRMHTLNNGVTVDQADQAVDGYLFELTKRDDLIVFAGFYDSTASRYVTAATWRTEAGADASRNAALGVGTGNYLSKMAESSYYLGTVNHFIELLEIHSAVLLGNAAIVRITTLANPSRYNETTMEPTIENVTLPFAEGLVGLLDYTTVFPNQPTSNTHFVTMSSWNTSADAVSGKADLNAHYAATYPGHFSSDSVYEGSIRNFWHSSPGTTPPLPGAGCKATPGPWVLFPTVLAACVAAITLA